jgi:hypothetical protein
MTVPMPLQTGTTLARGGKAVYGVPLGILMLEARFPRIPGDMGNATTWPFPVMYRVVTVSAPSLTPAHLAAAGCPADLPFAGTETGREFFRVLIKGEKDELDVALAREDILAAGRELVARHPEVGAIVLECTNMPPYAAALSAALGLPVFDIVSFITWFHAGLRPRAFG